MIINCRLLLLAGVADYVSNTWLESIVGRVNKLRGCAERKQQHHLHQQQQQYHLQQQQFHQTSFSCIGFGTQRSPKPTTPSPLPDNCVPALGQSAEMAEGLVGQVGYVLLL